MDLRTVKLASGINELKALVPAINAILTRVSHNLENVPQDELHAEVDKAIKMLHRMRQLILLIKNLSSPSSPSNPPLLS